MQISPAVIGGKLCLAIRRQDGIARHVKLKTTFDVWYGEKLKGGLRSYCKVKYIIIQDIF
jgi:hypothetical protein